MLVLLYWAFAGIFKNWNSHEYAHSIFKGTQDKGHRFTHANSESLDNQFTGKTIVHAFTWLISLAQSLALPSFLALPLSGGLWVFAHQLCENLLPTKKQDEILYVPKDELNSPTSNSYSNSQAPSTNSTSDGNDSSNADNDKDGEKADGKGAGETESKDAKAKGPGEGASSSQDANAGNTKGEASAAKPINGQALPQGVVPPNSNNGYSDDGQQGLGNNSQYPQSRGVYGGVPYSAVNPYVNGGGGYWMGSQYPTNGPVPQQIYATYAILNNSYHPQQ
jgi:hypothetical protein